MLSQDKNGNQLLELIRLSETDLSQVQPLTHAVVVARFTGGESLLVFNRYRRWWELAGGLIDRDETPRVCAVRELREESGQICEPDALRFVGAMKLLLQPNRFHSTIRVEYGALYVVDIPEQSPFVPTDEIAQVCWWDGAEAIGEIAVIDQKLLELVNP